MPAPTTDSRFEMNPKADDYLNGSPVSKPEEGQFELKGLTGFFSQDFEENNPSARSDYSSTNFGLINRPYPTDADFGPASHLKTTQWQRFEHYVRRLNAEEKIKAQAQAKATGIVAGGISPQVPNVSYKVLFLGRHGEGYHNVASNFYGPEAWDPYWSRQLGNGKWTWVDAQLTPQGIAQARAVHETWKRMIERERIPLPESYYVSPLSRCLETARLTFERLTPELDPFRPVVKESLRETIGLHTCDSRPPKSHIIDSYPNYVLEPGLDDYDVLFDVNCREPDAARDARLRAFLAYLFATDDNVFVSLTTHSGSIGSILEVIGQPSVAKVPIGGVVAVLVKGEHYGSPTTSLAN